MLLSGGIDSATCLRLVGEKYRTRALTFLYHGIAEREVKAALATGGSQSILEHRMVRLPDLREAEDIGVEFRGLPPTYIPMRNAVFYSLAASYAEEVGVDLIIGWHNRDDIEVFPDAGDGFFESMEGTIRAGSQALRRREVKILRPLSRYRKHQVVRLAVSKGVPLELTWSCHRGGSRHCWKCDGCLARRKAFLKARVSDPLDGRGKIS